MMQILLIIRRASLIVLFSSLPVLAFAQANSGTIANPLSPEFSDLSKFVAGSLKILVMVALPVITLFFVYSGFMFVMAQGNPEKISEAKKNFMYVVIGAILIMGAWIIATLIGGTVSQLTNGI